MKKSVLLFASLLLAAVSAIAQPAKPTVTYSDWASVEEKADIYLYNVEAGMFLSAGSAWGTRASLVGTKDKSTYNDLIMGAGEFKGNKWFIAAAQDQRDGKACYMFENKSGKNYLTADNKDGIWVDGDTGRPYDGWYIAKDNGDKTFQLGYMLRTEKKDEAGNVIKEGEQTVYDYSSMGIFGVQKFDEGNLDTYLDESTAYSTWAIVSTAEYEEKLPAFKLYYIAKGLEKLVADAKELGIEADFSSYEALLVKEGVTYDEIKTAIDKFSPTVNFGKVIADAKKADPARDWSKYEAIYVDPESTNADFTDNTKLINAFLALKKAVDDAKALDAAKTFAQAEALYADDEAALADIEAETKRVNAYSSLKKALDEATQKGCTVTDYTAVYNNAESTAEALAQAEEAVKGVISAKDIAESVKDASAANPANLSRYIVNATFDTVGDFKGWSTGFGAGGATSTCAEVWRKAFDVYQDIKGLPEGVYMVACNGYSRHNDNHDQDYAQWKSGAVSETKIYMKSETHGQYFTPVMFVSQGGSIDQQIGTGAQTAHAYEENGEKHTLYCPNSMAAANDYFHDGTNRYHNEAYGPLAAGETLRIGVSNTNSMYWSIFDDFELFYLGNGADAYQKWAESVKGNYNVSFDGEVYYGAPEKAYYEELAATLSNASDKDAVSAAILKMDLAVDSVAKSKTNYAEYVAALANAQKWLEENFGDDDNFYKLSDYMEADNAEDVAAWEFPNGPAKVIIPDYGVGGFEGILSAEAIAEETTYIKNLLGEATRSTLADGSDLTSLINNPGFEEAGGKGWKLDSSKGGTSSLTNWHGGNADNYCAEAFQQNFDIYQEIEGVKDGLYEVSVQAFYRTANNQAAYEAYLNDPEMKGDAKVYPEVYINEFSSKIRNVMEIQFADKELDENNTNTYHPDGSEIYTLDGMTSASNAFSLANPERNFTMSAYGVVQDGKIRLGLRKLEGPTNAGQWTLWDNFKLTYRAKNPEIAAKVLASKSEELGDLLEAESDNMTEPVLKSAQEAYAESKKTDLNNAAKYDVLIETNNALVAAKENLQKVETYKKAEETYLAAADELDKVLPYVGNETAPIWVECDEMDTELEADAYMELGNEELDELVAKLAALTEKIKEANKEAQIANASDENPADLTMMIVNPGFEENSLNGWTNSGTIEGQAQGNDSFDNKQGSYYAEKWHVNGTVDINQTVANLPAGVYEITAYVYSSAEDALLYVNNASVAVTTSGLYSVIVKLDEPSDLKFGVSWSDTGDKWTCLDDFKLTCYGTESEKELTPTDITEIEIDAQPANVKNGKFFENGQIVIYKNGLKYSATGVLLQ